MQPTRRYDSRHPVNQLVAPGPLVGTTESFVIETLSTGGMSLLRSARRPSIVDKKGLDLRFAWLSFPLPGTDTKLTALLEVLHRQRIGAMERVRVRFELMSFDDRVKLCDFLDQKYG